MWAAGPVGGGADRVRLHGGTDVAVSGRPTGHGLGVVDAVVLADRRDRRDGGAGVLRRLEEGGELGGGAPSEGPGAQHRWPGRGRQERPSAAGSGAGPGDGRRAGAMWPVGAVTLQVGLAPGQDHRTARQADDPPPQGGKDARPTRIAPGRRTGPTPGGICTPGARPGLDNKDLTDALPARFGVSGGARDDIALIAVRL